MYKVINRILNRVLYSNMKNINDKLDNMQLLQAKEILAKQSLKNKIKDLSEVELKVFSQWGEDGIIQYLINAIDIKNNKYFIEFGVENYTEANTRFLLINNNWSGLVIDSDYKNIEYIKKDDLYWKYDLNAVNAYITKDNINNILADNGIQGEVGLLSIDIDGNDYWIWKSIEAVNPLIVICEYNSIFGKELAVTVPYKEKFNRTKEHYSNLYFGASLKALYLLAKEKGYTFIGTTSAGNDAFFVRNDIAYNFNGLTVEEGYVRSQFRESRDKKGTLTFSKGEDRLKMISDMPVYDIEKGNTYRIKELFSLES